jgi:serine protease Do
VIGINVAIAEGANNIGFAIPVNIVKEALKVFNSTGKFPAKAFLGVRYQAVSQRAAIINQVPQGMYVVEVVSGSPAEKAGVQVDDIITKIDGTSLNEKNDLSEILGKKRPGDTIKLEIWRNEETKNLEATLSEAKS